MNFWWRRQQPKKARQHRFTHSALRVIPWHKKDIKGWIALAINGRPSTERRPIRLRTICTIDAEGDLTTNIKYGRRVTFRVEEKGTAQGFIYDKPRGGSLYLIINVSPFTAYPGDTVTFR